LLLCNPHNPIGKVFSRSELERLVQVCLRYGVKICSDEVHCDLILNEKEHVVLASLSPEVCGNTITLMAPSKTFNVAGLGCGFAIISDEKLRQSFRLSMRSITPGVNPLAYAACEAAYRFGEPWRLELLEYLKGHVALIENFVAAHRKHLSLISPEATYLAWLDCRGMGLKDPSSHFKAFRVGLSAGSQFGDAQSVRLNFGCPKSTLELGLERMGQALAAL
jgi:cysteine-S-conjugate beta-lyase